MKGVRHAYDNQLRDTITIQQIRDDHHCDVNGVLVICL